MRASTRLTHGYGAPSRRRTQVAQAALAANLLALMNYDDSFPGDVGTASAQFEHLVLTPVEPICFQAPGLGGHQDSTQMSLTKPKS